MDVFLICFGAGLVWGWWCSRQTFIDIRNMRSSYFRTMTDVDVPRDIYERLMKEDNRSSIERHIFYRMTFRDWKKLYPIYFDYFRDEI